MSDSDDVGPVAKKRNLPQSMLSVAPSGGHKYTASYAYSLYYLGIMDKDGFGTIPSVPDHSEVVDLDNEVSKLVSAPSDLPSLSTYINNFFLKLQPNEATWVNFLCACLFRPKLPISSEMKAVIVNEFSGPFKSHDVCQLARQEEAIKFPLVKRDPLREASATLQTPAEVDLRSKSDFVFAASTEVYL